MVHEFLITPEILKVSHEQLGSDISSLAYPHSFVKTSGTVSSNASKSGSTIVEVKDKVVLTALLDRKTTYCEVLIATDDFIDYLTSETTTSVTSQIQSYAGNGYLILIDGIEASAQAGDSDEVRYRQNVTFELGTTLDYPQGFAFDLLSQKFFLDSVPNELNGDFLQNVSAVQTAPYVFYNYASDQWDGAEVDWDFGSFVDFWKLPTIEYNEPFTLESYQDYSCCADWKSKKRLIFEGELKLIKGTTDFSLEYTVKNPLPNLEFKLPDGIEWDTTVSPPENVEVDWENGIIRVKVMRLEPIRFVLLDSDGNRFYVKIRLDYSQAFLVAES